MADISPGLAPLVCVVTISTVLVCWLVASAT